MYSIPIVLFIFKREKVVKIIERISKIKPRIIYIIADGGRNEEEQKQCEKCRSLVEKAINWECKIIKNYSDKNRGVYENIANGAKWVFSKEKMAIFLEDDNLPELSFFSFCEELLIKYENDNRILWICGTNYLERYSTYNGASYVFSKHMLPCGWASWANKFCSYYDDNMIDCNCRDVQKAIRTTFPNKALFKQFVRFWNSEKSRINNGLKPLSWDYQMDYSIRSNGFYGIVPTANLIKNIGADEDSIHGGTSLNLKMTKRFCNIPSHEIIFPIVHPSKVMIDYNFEKKIGKILLYPLELRIKNWIIYKLRKLLRVKEGETIHEKFKIKK